MSDPISDPISETDPYDRPPPEPRSGRRTRPWIVTSVAVAVLVIVGVFVAAGYIADGNAEESLSAFERSSNDVAATLKLEIERTQGLIESAAAFLAVDPVSSSDRFARLSAALNWRERHPEVGGFGFVIPVPADRLDRFTARMEADPINPENLGEPYEISPPGQRPYYCLGALGQWRQGFQPDFALGEDFCAGVAGEMLEHIRDSGHSLYFPLPLGEQSGLAITVPVYRGGGVPADAGERRARFLGWLGTIVAQEQLLASALSSQPDIAATLRFRGHGPLPASFSGGEASDDAAEMSIELTDDWVLETAGDVKPASVWASFESLAVLGIGFPAGILLGALVLVLGTGRARARRMVDERTDQLRHQALHDSLTGLANRDLIADRAEHLLARNRRHRTAGAALFIDLDDFKNVNDSLGHDAGDELLIAVADRLTTALRDVDTVGRLGGDEFVVLIDGSEFQSAPELVAERLLEIMRHPFDIEAAPGTLPVTASIGIAIGDRESHSELLRDADVALYNAKTSGKNCYKLFDREMWNAASHRIGLEFDLRTALERDEFCLLYQPIYELDELRLIGVEALLRWDHPDRGTIRPDEFIPVLERTGQIAPVGRWVLETACRQVADWHARYGELCLSINLSARQLETSRIVEEVAETVEEVGFDPSFLVLEVTETALMTNVDVTAEILGELKALGVKIAIDDFGTGYSSMAYLRKFPVDCLKIDRTFTDAVATSSDPAPLFDTLVRLGRELGLTTLAEGVERTEQVGHLRAEQVDKVQGFLFSRPVDPERFEDRLAEALEFRS